MTCTAHLAYITCGCLSHACVPDGKLAGEPDMQQFYSNCLGNAVKASKQVAYGIKQGM